MTEISEQQFYEAFGDLQADIGADGLLRIICELANDVGLEVGVRLFVSGGVVSGQLVGGATYFNALANEIEPAEEKGQGSTPGGGLATGFRNMASGYEKRAAKSRADESDEERSRTVFIHLKDAWLHTPSNDAPLLVGLWRGRLASVDGWSLGTYGTAD